MPEHDEIALCSNTLINMLLFALKLASFVFLYNTHCLLAHSPVDPTSQKLFANPRNYIRKLSFNQGIKVPLQKDFQGKPRQLFSYLLTLTCWCETIILAIPSIHGFILKLGLRKKTPFSPVYSPTTYKVKFWQMWQGRTARESWSRCPF